jgi:large repetitive protein
MRGAQILRHASTGTGPYTGSTSYTLTADSPTISVAPTSVVAATVGTTYSQMITASGGTVPYGYAVTSGSLPAGLTLNSNGALSGTATAGGTFNFTITATDSSTGIGPYTGSRAYTLVLSAPTITVSPATLPDGTYNSDYSQTVTASGGTTAYTFAVTSGSLPPGLSLSSTGVLSGMPSAAGNYNFSITATDSSTGTGPYASSRTYTIRRRQGHSGHHARQSESDLHRVAAGRNGEHRAFRPHGRFHL